MNLLGGWPNTLRTKLRLYPFFCSFLAHLQAEVSLSRVTRRSRSDESHLLLYSCFSDFTGVTLVSDDTTEDFTDVTLASEDADDHDFPKDHDGHEDSDDHEDRVGQVARLQPEKTHNLRLFSHISLIQIKEENDCCCELFFGLPVHGFLPGTGQPEQFLHLLAHHWLNLCILIGHQGDLASSCKCCEKEEPLNATKKLEAKS